MKSLLAKLFYILCPEDLSKAKLKTKIAFVCKGFVLLMLASGYRKNELFNVDRRQVKFSTIHCSLSWNFVADFKCKFETWDHKFVQFSIRGLQISDNQCSNL